MKPSKLVLLATSLSLGFSYQAQAASATWVGGTGAAVWNSNSNWGNPSAGAAFPGTSGTTDVATFSSAANVTSGNLGLGKNISIGGIVLNTGGNVVVTDNSHTLTLNGGSAISVGAGQSLTLNTNTTLAAGTTLAVGSGSSLTFGSGTFALGNFAQTFTGLGGTINLNTGITGGGSTAQLKITQGVTVNLAGTMSGTFSSSAPILMTSTNGTASVLNLQVGTGAKTQLGSAGTNEKATIMITTSGVTDSGIVLVSGAGTGGANANVFTIGANISGGGTATYANGVNINNGGGGNAATVIFSANSGTTLNFNGPITGSATSTATSLQISGGGVIAFGSHGSNAATSFATSSAANAMDVTGNTVLQLNNTATSSLTAITSNTTVENGSTIQLLNTNQMPSNTLTLNGAGGSTGGSVITATTGALENLIGNNALGAAVVLGSASTISSDANTMTLTGGINNNGKALTFTGAGNTAVTTTGISGSGGLTKSGTGNLALTTANSYSGTTSLTGGKTYVTNGSGSATGTNTVAVSGSTTLLGGNGTISGAVTLSSGATLYSGGVATGTPTTGPGTGLNLTSSLAVNGASLTFALSNTASSTYLSPATSTTYLNLGTTGTISFTGSDTINLVDLTSGGLSLRLNNPYLLISANAATMFTGLVVEDSTGHIGLSDSGTQGTVLGVWAGGSNPLSDYTAITINELSADGSTTLADATTADPGYYQPSLVLVGGDLEVVPEPGTWALMLGGLALLVVIQRRRNQSQV